MEGRLSRARERVYELGINDQIKQYIAKCDIRRSLDNKQQKETLICEVPSRLRTKVGTYLFVIDRKDYLITLDCSSNFWEIDCLANAKSTTVTEKLKVHFAQQGILDTMILENGPQYATQDVQKFSNQWGFPHGTPSPGSPQSNGKAELAVKTSH